MYETFTFDYNYKASEVVAGGAFKDWLNKNSIQLDTIHTENYNKITDVAGPSIPFYIFKGSRRIQVRSKSSYSGVYVLFRIM